MMSKLKTVIRKKNVAHPGECGLIWSILSVYAVKIVTIAVNLFSVPLAAAHLGIESYGLWVVMSSIISLFILFDFGLANNLTTMLAQSLAIGDREASSRQVSATLWAVLAGSLLFLTLFLALHSFVDWSEIFNTTSAKSAKEATDCSLLIGVIAATQLVGNICQRLYAGLQQSHIGNFWQGIGAFGGFLALLGSIKMKGQLASLTFSIGVVPGLVQLLGLFCVLVFGDYGKLLSPRKLRLADYRSLAHGGLLMFIVNLQAIFWLSKDSMVITQKLGLHMVGGYNTAFRIYQSVFALIIGSLGSSLWPAYANAYARGDRLWIQQTLRRSLVFGVGSMVIFGLVFLTVGRIMITWYVGPALAISQTQLALLAVYFIILSFVNLLGALFMGYGKTGIIAFGGLFGGCVTLPIAWFALGEFGLNGLILTNIFCSIVFQLLPLRYLAEKEDWLSFTSNINPK